MLLNTGLIVFSYPQATYLRLGLCCRGLSVAVLSVSLLCRGWDRWLFIGAVRVLCGNGCHSSSLVHRHDQLPLSNRWWMFSRFTCLFNTKLALPHTCSVVIKLPPHHGLSSTAEVMLNFEKYFDSNLMMDAIDKIP